MSASPPARPEESPSASASLTPSAPSEHRQSNPSLVGNEDFAGVNALQRLSALRESEADRALSTPFYSSLMMDAAERSTLVGPSQLSQAHSHPLAPRPPRQQRQSTVSLGGEKKATIDTVYAMLIDCAQALEALGASQGKQPASPNHVSSARRSVVKDHPTSVTAVRQSLSRARQSVSFDLLGSDFQQPRSGSMPFKPWSPSGTSGSQSFENTGEGDDGSTALMNYDKTAAPGSAVPQRHPGGSHTTSAVLPTPGERRRTKVQFHDEGASLGSSPEVKTTQVPSQTSMLGHDSEMDASALAGSRGDSTSSPQRSSSGTLFRRSESEGPRLGVLSNSGWVTAIDMAYVLCSLALCLTAVTYVALSHSEGDVNLVGPITTIVVAQVVSMVWCCSRFVIQTTKGEWEIVDRIEDISALYRKTWLPFDLFCVIPFEWICFGWATPYAFWLTLRQLVRIVRLILLSKSGNPLQRTRNKVQMLVFVSFVVFVIHCIAVGFRDIQNDSPLSTTELNYVDALYWAIMTLTSVGYGDVLPVADDSHRIYACFVMFCGVAMIASVTAFATSVLTATDALQDTIQDRKQMLASMIEHYRIPWEVQVEIIALLPTALSAENERKFSELVSNMPAFMVERIEGYTRAKALSSSIPLFAELPVGIVLELTTNLQKRFYQANEVIIAIGDEGREMFFMVAGTAEVIVPIDKAQELVVAVLRGGSFFGEMALVQDVKRTASIVAVALCEVLVLSKVNFLDLVQRHKLLRDIFLNEVFARHNVTSLAKQEVVNVPETRSEDDEPEEEPAEPEADFAANNPLDPPQ